MWQTLFLTLVFSCSDISSFSKLHSFSKELKKKTQEELYEEMRKRYTDPEPPRDLSLKLSKALLERKAYGIGTDECLTCTSEVQ